MNRTRKTSRHRIGTTRVPVLVFAALTAGAVITSASLSCKSKKHKPSASLIVTSHSPMETHLGSDPLQIRFDEPVVADELVGENVEVSPVSIAPAAVLTSHWHDRQTLVVTPESPLQSSTRYQVFLQGELSWYSGAVGREVSKPYGLLVTHFFNHQTHHRGQVNGALTALGQKLDDTDLPFMPEACDV